MSSWRPDAEAREAGDRVEELLADLRTRAGPEAADVAEELVGCLVQLYGAGLETIMRVVGEDQRLQALLIADPLVESLLLVHDLHPLDIGARAQRAVEQVLPQFGAHAGRVELLGLDDQGVIHLRLEAAGQWERGRPEVVIVMDAGYNVTRLAWLLADLPVIVAARVRADRVFYRPAPPRAPPTMGASQNNQSCAT